MANGPATGRAHIEVDADLKHFRRRLATEGRAAAQAAGARSGNAFTNAFRRHMRTEQVFTRFRTQLMAMRGQFSPVLTTIRGFGKGVQGVIGVVTNAWKNLDDEVRLIIGLILTHAGQLAALLSTFSGIATSVGSSIGMALGSIVPLVGIGATAAISIGLLVSAMDEMRNRFPSINRGIDRIKEAWQDQASAFAEFAGPGVGRMLNALATRLGSVDFGTPLGKSMGKINDAFANVLNGPGVKAFFNALTKEYPKALQGVGTGVANLVGALSSLLAGAAPLAERLGKSFQTWTKNLAEAAEEARKSGRMQEVFDRVGDSLSAVMDVLGSLGKAIGAVFMATSEYGNELLRGFARLIDRFTDWVKSAEGQERINEWLDTTRQILPSLSNLLAGAGKFLARLVTPTTIGLAKSLLDTLGEWLPIFADVLVAVSKLDIIGNLAAFLNTVTQAARPLLPTLYDLATLMGESVRGAIEKLGPFLDGLVKFLKPVMDNMIDLGEAILPKAIDAFGKIATALDPVFEIFGRVAQLVGSVVIPVLEWLISGIIQGLVDAFQGFARVVQGVYDIVAGIFTGDWPRVWSGVKDVVLGALQGIWGLAQVWLFGKLLGIFKAVGGFLLNLTRAAWTGIRTAISTVVTSIRTLVSNVWTAMKTAFQTGGSFLSSIWAALWAGIRTLVSGVVNGIRAVISTAWSWISTASSATFNAIRTVISTVWTAIRTAISTTVSAIRTAISTAWNAIRTVTSTVMTTIRTVISTVWTAIRTAISTVVSSIRTVISNTFNTVRTFITTVMGRIRSTISTVWNAIRTTIRTVVNGIRSTISTVFNTVRTFITTVMSRIRTTFSTVWNAIRDIVRRVINAVKSVITSNMNNIRSIMTTVWNAIRNTISTVTNAIRSVISRVFNGIRNTIRSIMSGIRSVISSVWNGIRSVISSVVNGIRSVVSRVFNGIRSVVSSVSSSIRSAISAAWNAARAIVSNAMSTIRTTVVNGFITVVNTARTLPGRIWNALTTLVTNMKRIGINMIIGMINGIKEMAGRAINAAKSVVEGAINGAKNLLGIKSPSRVFRQFGRYTGEGLALGFGDEEKHVRDAMSDLVGVGLKGVDLGQYVDAGLSAAEAFANGLTEKDLPTLSAGVESGTHRLSRGLVPSGAQGVYAGQRPVSGGTVIEEGAITLATPAADGRIVAEQLLDDIARNL